VGAVPDHLTGEPDGVRQPVEEQILLAVEVREDRHRRGLLPAAERVQRRLLEAVGAFAAGGTTGTTRTTHGLVAGITATSRRFPVLGHFAGLMFRPDLVDQDDPVLREHTAVADGVVVPQHDLELLLAEHCTRLGTRIRRGVEVRDLRPAAAEVTVTTSEGDLTAGWVVAADGGRSAIRGRLGVPFEGTDPEMVGYQAIADFEDASGLSRGWTWTPAGVYAYGPIPGRILVARFGPQPPDRDAPVSLEELQAVVREVTGVPVTLRGLTGRATRWSDNARMARSYRQGRVLLAGDAAHVHSPFSAQGLNLGLGDAINLGWKLAATINGWAPDGLIDSYQSERQPIAAWVLDWTRAQVALLRGDPRTAQLRRVVGEVLYDVPGVLNRMVALSSGLGQRYDMAGDAATPAGSIVGDVELGIGGRIADHAHDGRFVLVDRSSDGRLVAAAGQRVRYVADPGDGGSLLIRPDGVIAWAGDSADGLEDAIRRWAGGQSSSTQTLTPSSRPMAAS
jgi:2-polyprenyl-6-methoxyphenol hydroxylase-like FAD-dependent oxidoreductase